MSHLRVDAQTMKIKIVLGCALMLAAFNLPALELRVETPKMGFKSSEGVSFTVSFHNDGTTNVLLNGGKLLGNGAQIWDSVTAELKTEDGQRIPMTLGWQVPGIGGRIYFLGVPLRPGGSFALPVGARDYYVGTGERLKPGKYEVCFVYRGQQSEYRDSTQMPACWEGEARSNTLKFEVLADQQP
jgi:hypothetical protein